MASEEFTEMQSAEAAFDVGGSLERLEAADKAYYSALALAKAEWDSVPEGDAKDSARDNANEMCWHEKVFQEADELSWFRYAFASLVEVE